MNKFLIVLCFALSACSDVDHAPNVTEGGRLRWEYHGGPSSQAAYIITDKQTHCQFLYLLGDAVSVIPGTCTDE